jgi:hypothetical protein
MKYTCRQVSCAKGQGTNVSLVRSEHSESKNLRYFTTYIDTNLIEICVAYLKENLQQHIHV